VVQEVKSEAELRNRLLSQTGIMYNKKQETALQLTKRYIPSLVIGENEKGYSAAVLARLNIEMLNRKWGYSKIEAEKVISFLQTMKVPYGKENDFEKNIQPLIYSAIERNHYEAELQKNVLQYLDKREDVVYNLLSKIGMHSYMDSTMFHDSKLEKDELMKYIARMQILSGHQGHTDIFSESYKDDVQVYARYVNPDAYSEIRRLINASVNSNSNHDNMVVHLSADGVMQGDILPVIHQELSGGNRLRKRNRQDRVPLNSNCIPLESGGMKLEEVSDNMDRTRLPSQQGLDAEFDRQSKIDVNYKLEKEMITKEKSLILARSEIHEVGHAEGSKNETDIRYFVKEHRKEVLLELKGKEK
jgi:hypothetical protein